MKRSILVCATVLAIFALVHFLHAQQLRPSPAPACCVITAIDSHTGIVTAKQNATGRTFEFQVPNPKLLAQIRPGVRTRPPTNVCHLRRESIYLTGNTVELGNWGRPLTLPLARCSPPNYPNWFINASVPAGTTIQFKFIKIASNGAVTWEAGNNHQYTVPTSGTGSVNVNWQF